VAEEVADRKKLNIINPKKRYNGYFSIDVFDIAPPKKRSMAKKESGSSRYHKTPRKLPSFLMPNLAFAIEKLKLSILLA
jgi:hypothetical protein